jgi:hypothetical protein
MQSPLYEELKCFKIKIFFPDSFNNVSNLAFHDLYPVHYQARTNGLILVWLGFTGVALAANKHKKIRYSSTNAY